MSEGKALSIDPEFKALIPPLTSEEYAQLEANLLSEGCRDALVMWNGVIVDGHNRYEICTRHNLTFSTVEREFPSRDDVIIWIIQNQFGRRNLTPFVRSELALRLKEVFSVKAKRNQAHGQTAPGKTLLLNSTEALNTRAELAKTAETSEDTIRKVETITKKAPEPVKEAARRGDISVNQAYEVTKAIEKAPEPVKQKVEQGIQSGKIPTTREIKSLVIENRRDESARSCRNKR